MKRIQAEGKTDKMCASVCRDRGKGGADAGTLCLSSCECESDPFVHKTRANRKASRDKHKTPTLLHIHPLSLQLRVSPFSAIKNIKVGENGQFIWLDRHGTLLARGRNSVVEYRTFNARVVGSTPTALITTHNPSPILYFYSVCSLSPLVVI